jgi:hypothetical protein
VTAFAELMTDVMTRSPRFGHRQHVEVTWLAIRAVGVPAAIGLVSAGIRETARYAGAPRKYHVTVSRAWVELVGHHVADGETFDEFIARVPELLDKRLLTRHYRPATLAGEQARTVWVEPDLSPLPG